MVVIDSDVFLIAHRYVRDVRAELNTRFLAAVKTAAPALTIYNLMEILGVLSFNLSAVQMRAWPDWLKARHSLAILWPDPNYTSRHLFFEQVIYHLPLARMTTQPTAFLDALAIEVAERTPDVRAFVTWNARHFANKTRLRVLTPAQYLDENGIHPETRSVIR